MAQVLFTNNAEAVLAGAITAVQTSISVGAGQGAKFPTIGGGSGDWFPVTLRSASAMEICRCTGRTGDVLTVTRAQEGTVGTAFAAGDLCQLRFTSAAMSEIVARIASLESSMLLQSVTGDSKYRPGTATIAGWVRANGLTIGNGASSATERANGDTANLFSFLWTTFADAQCPVSGGRGASAAADFAANKRLTLPDAAGRAFICLDNLGAGVKNRLTATTAAPNGTTPGATGGAETRVIAVANLPVHSHPVSSATGTADAGGNHNHGGATPAGGGTHSHTGATTDTEAAHNHAGSVTDTAAAHHHSGSSVTGAGTHSHGNITDDSSNNFEVFVGSVSSGSRRIVQDSVEGGGAASGLLEVPPNSGGHAHGLAITSDGNHSHAVTVQPGGSHSHAVTVPSTSSGHSHVINDSGTHTHPLTLSITIGNTGSGTAIDNQSPFIALGTLYLKL